MNECRNVEIKKISTKIKKSSKNPFKKIRRGLRNKCIKSNQKDFVMFSVNAAGLKKKILSFQTILEKTKCDVFMVQETHFSTKGQLSIPNFILFESIRSKNNGGTVIGVHKDYNPVLINLYEGDLEVIVVEIQVKNEQVRLISGYGPQENMALELRKPFFDVIESEIIDAESKGKHIIIAFDANSKVGMKYIPNHNVEQSQNGKLLGEIIDRNNLIVVNGLTCCDGIITRRRILEKDKEETVIDYVIISEGMKHSLLSMLIDQSDDYALFSISNDRKIKRSDHNSIITRFNITPKPKKKTKKIEYYNLRNRYCQNKFKDITQNQNIFMNCLMKVDSEDVDKIYDKFLSTFWKVVRMAGFKKIRYSNSKNNEKINLYKKWLELKKIVESDNPDPVKVIEYEKTEDLLSVSSNQNFNKVCNAFKKVDFTNPSGISSNTFWKLKKKLVPGFTDSPSSLEVDGIVYTKSDDIKKALLKAYKERFENRKFDPQLNKYKK